MTKKELRVAQYLHGVASRASDRAFDICPNWPEARGPFGADDSVGRKCVEIGRLAGDAFWELTGRFYHDVPETDLSTINPAAWTRSVRKGGKLARTS